jgi:ectoine hydroxylase-related dioxygenase (phytanoyl-CoA dioxygenase family)
LEDVSAVPLVCRAGSAITFESRLWHFQGRSSSAKTRLSILNGYCMHFIRPQDDCAASLRDEVYEQLNNDHRHNTNARYPYIPELRRGDAQHAAPFVNMGSNET